MRYFYNTLDYFRYLRKYPTELDNNILKKPARNVFIIVHACDTKNIYILLESFVQVIL